MTADDLASLIEGVPKGQEITAPLGGAQALPLGEVLVRVSESCHQLGRSFTVEFEVDGDADVTAALGQHSGSLAPLLEATRQLRRQGVAVRWLVPLLDGLVYRLEAMFSLAADEGVDAVLIPARMASGVIGSAPSPGSDECSFAQDFITYRLLEEDRHRSPPARLALYRVLLESPDDANLPRGDREAVMLEAGDRGGAGWTMRRVPRPALGAEADQDSNAGGQAVPLREQAIDVAGVLFEAQRALLQWLAALTGQPKPANATREQRLPSVLLIGAYGGDHIGDSAILGGVLLRIHQRYGTTRAVLVSQRPAHSRRLVSMLDTPVEVEVDLYEQSRIPAHLAQADALVFAGGPLADMPKQLVKHLYTASLARRRGLPFIIEGIGAGPFVRRASAWTGRRVVRLADRITVRTEDDAKADLVADLVPERGRDPAFDYLETRAGPLTKLPTRDQRWMDVLLEGTEGRPRVGLNLRPIRDLYTVGVPVHQRVEHTRAIEARFEEAIADGLRQFQQMLPQAPCFVFFPMNAIQFGSSDLRSAYRLKRLLGGEVDLRIWEGDPSIDGVVALLRQLDVVVAMRFHAAIYALSQGRRVIGIDYRIGRRDKVAALLSDFGQSENCGRIDQVTAAWLTERLRALTS